MSTNPVLTLQLPFTLPDFAAATPAHYRDAIAGSMAHHLALLATLRDDSSPATIENVLGAWEDAGADLRRALNAFYAVRSSDTNDELDAIDEEFAPLLAAHDDAIHLDRALYARLRALEARILGGEVEADEQDRYALDETLREFRRAGVELGDDDQARLRELNRILAELGSRFETLNRGARNAGSLTVVEADLAGLTTEEKESLHDGDGYRIDLVNTTQQPLAAKLTDAGVRRRLFEASTTRALSGDFDTREIVVATARARAERARLLGYPNHAAIVAEAGCAKSTDAILDVLVPLAQAGLAKARDEAAQLAGRYAELSPGEVFTAADWSFVEAIVRRERYSFDESQLGGFLQVDKVLAAVYGAAEELYGITFHPRADLVGHAPDTRTFEVHDADGSTLGLFVMDFWARPTKSGGAWMTNIVEQSTRDQALPVVTNNCNYTPTTTAITWDDVITMFHEFGHALHGLLAHSRYASRSGPNTPTDFVEFPSQVNEHWAWTPGRVLPAEWVERLTQADKFGQGYATAETELSSLLDLVWHMTPLDELPASADEVEDFERKALEKYGLVEPLVPPRYRSQYFAHIWGGGYAASYYGYAWAKVMDADAVAWFDDQTGPVREAGEHFRRTLLAPGGSVDPMETYRRFRGRDPQLQPLLDRLGLEL
ncbi:peptidyl-dipeptidase Dcp [Tessaracoccus bendigoensis DSM 12906]|uniref:Peptidyl-dipeptidase Dcp n=1 Tax=Tessaracoccus bendigoensis DSM 12906 TaxID=1123357 RepID=A0A1M6ID70_9ACTN|nr:M3 family metallopeptidase [Tessaracoccus bendigoensis]SHJ32370.1 peptidyl-dipeptidase Dcp [Tessaracoccus bendigoensis DSM 12906]